MIQLEQPNLPYFVLSVSECIEARPILKFPCDYCDVSVVIDGSRIADFQLARKTATTGILPETNEARVRIRRARAATRNYMTLSIG